MIGLKWLENVQGDPDCLLCYATCDQDLTVLTFG